MQRPQLPAARVRAILQQVGVTEPVAILAVRGYFLNTMGAKRKNDRGIYDDAIFLVTPQGVYAFNANTDPSVQRKGIATLKPGVYPYKKGNHGISRPGGGYPALRPATPREELPVTRDGEDNPRPGVAINIHCGGEGNTSSEGCQTLPPSQWPELIKKTYAAMDKAKMKTIAYALVVNDGSIA